MPTYDYKCQTCGKTFERILTLRELNSIGVCPFCTSSETKRMISPVRHSFAEGNRGESSKPDTYWENAEREKQRKIAKKREQILEQAMYNDPKCPEKYRGFRDKMKEAQDRIKTGDTSPPTGD